MISLDQFSHGNMPLITDLYFSAFCFYTHQLDISGRLLFRQCSIDLFPCSTDCRVASIRVQYVFGFSYQGHVIHEHNKKNSGPKIEPSGTPVMISDCLDSFS